MNSSTGSSVNIFGKPGFYELTESNEISSETTFVPKISGEEIRGIRK